MRLADLKGRSVAVWGAGREGRAAVRAIAPHRPSRLMTVDDSVGFLSVRWEPELAALAPLAGGDHAFPALVTADVVVRSPGVPAAHPWLAEIRDRGIPITTGSALWMAAHASRTIGVTGSERRGATAALIRHLLTALGRPGVLLGRSGVPLLDLPEAEEYVVELSGWQCADLASSPHVAVVTALAARAGDAGRLACAESPERCRDMLDLLRHGPEMIVVNGADRHLRDEIRGMTDVNRFPPIPAGAGDSRFRVEDGTVFCSDDPLFPGSTAGPDGDVAVNAGGGDGHHLSLCVALAVLDGLGVDVVGRKAELAAALASGADVPSGVVELPERSEGA